MPHYPLNYPKSGFNEVDIGENVAGKVFKVHDDHAEGWYFLNLPRKVIERLCGVEDR